jgi:hypothetical protein
MNQELSRIKNSHVGQFQYLDRWVDKKNFRAFVYDRKGNEKLANSFDEFESLIASGLWFASKCIAHDKVRKPKNAVFSDG